MNDNKDGVGIMLFALKTKHSVDATEKGDVLIHGQSPIMARVEPSFVAEKL